MKKVIKQFLFVASVFFVVFIGASVSFAESKWDKTDVPLDKVWTIHFNDELDTGSIERGIYIEDSNGKRLSNVKSTIKIIL